MTQPTNLCIHRANPAMCPTCFRLPKPGTQAAPAAKRDLGIPNMLGAPMGVLPGQALPPVIGDRTGSNVGVAGTGHPEIAPEVKERYRYPHGRPKGSGDPTLQPQPHSTAKAWVRDADGLEVPPPRESIIDQLPSHPKAPPPRF